jgi:hypothetical protein
MSLGASILVEDMPNSVAAVIRGGMGTMLIGVALLGVRLTRRDGNLFARSRIIIGRGSEKGLVEPILLILLSLFKCGAVVMILVIIAVVLVGTGIGHKLSLSSIAACLTSDHTMCILPGLETRSTARGVSATSS